MVASRMHCSSTSQHASFSPWLHAAKQQHTAGRSISRSQRPAFRPAVAALAVAVLCLHATCLILELQQATHHSSKLTAQLSDATSTSFPATDAATDSQWTDCKEPEAQHHAQKGQQQQQQHVVATPPQGVSAAASSASAAASQQDVLRPRQPRLLVASPPADPSEALRSASSAPGRRLLQTPPAGSVDTGAGTCALLQIMSACWPGRQQLLWC
jgi:hypothetical protein